MKRSIILPSLVIAFVALSPAGVALADNPHNTPTIPTPPVNRTSRFRPSPRHRLACN